MDEAGYSRLSDVELQTLYLQKDDRRAFFEVGERYKPQVMANWRGYRPFLVERYTVAFADFFDRLLEEALTKWKPEVASFYTFFVLQVCRRRVIDFRRKLWQRYAQEPRLEGDLGASGDDAAGKDISGILGTGRPPLPERVSYSAEEIQLMWDALEREKPDCQALLRLMCYDRSKTFDERAEVLALQGLKKKATGWRDTWKRNRERVAAYIRAKREET